MATFIFAFLFFLLVVAGMAIGVIFRKQPIKGSCGGMGALGLDTTCDICGGNPTACDEGTRNDTGSGVNVYVPAVDKP